MTKTDPVKTVADTIAAIRNPKNISSTPTGPKSAVKFAFKHASLTF